MIYDVCIIGGGAAGLAAAASFHKDTSVCILEKNPVPGKKILATGGGRCNITNKACPECEKTREFFRKLGIETTADEEGRYFPYTNRASDVVKVLVTAQESSVESMYGFTVTGVSRSTAEGTETFTVAGETGPDRKKSTVCTKKVLLTTGGKAAPQYGTAGDGYSIARALGHTVTKVYPILSGIECEADNVDFAGLKGIRAKGRATLLKDGKAIAEETGEIQFTKDGISGICIFNLTPHIRAEEGETVRDAMRRYRMSLDLAPDFSEADIKGRRSSFGIVTEQLAEAVAVDELKDWKLQVTGVKGWRDAQATAGGVSLEEVNMETMESRIVPGLYFAGEILDIQGPCGGYNLQNAWETGIKAASGMESKG